MNFVTPSGIILIAVLKPQTQTLNLQNLSLFYPGRGLLKNRSTLFHVKGYAATAESVGRSELAHHHDCKN